MANWTECFEIFKKENESIDINDLAVALRSQGALVEDKEIKKLCSRYTNTNRIDLKSFVAMMTYLI